MSRFRERQKGLIKDHTEVPENPGTISGKWVNNMRCQLKSCHKCGGDLVLDGDEWRCWQCGQYYYPKPENVELPAQPFVRERSNGRFTATASSARRQPQRRSPRHVNSLIMAKVRSDDRWWQKNQEVVSYLDEGRTVKAISALVGRGERQIRIIRERLNELRAPKSAQAASG